MALNSWRCFFSFNLYEGHTPFRLIAWKMYSFLTVLTVPPNNYHFFYNTYSLAMLLELLPKNITKLIRKIHTFTLWLIRCSNNCPKNINYLIRGRRKNIWQGKDEKKKINLAYSDTRQCNFFTFHEENEHRFYYLSFCVAKMYSFDKKKR